jgi:hypothetical protein
MTVRVVGAGLGRTGTLSLKVALEQLLGGRCYHMIETFEHPEQGEVWAGAAAGRLPDWNEFLADYVATVDWPACTFWREISDVNPDALVLLSVRESADAWWKSANATIFGAMRRGIEKGDPEDWRSEFIRDTFTPQYLDEAAAKAAYDRHNEYVRAHAPAGRLLEYRAGSGWAPICDALGLPVPAEPFPHVNTTEDFQRMFVEESAPE